MLEEMKDFLNDAMMVTYLGKWMEPVLAMLKDLSLEC